MEFGLVANLAELSADYSEHVLVAPKERLLDLEKVDYSEKESAGCLERNSVEGSVGYLAVKKAFCSADY